jgi:hypothetical protein
LLSVAIVEELELIWVCCGWRTLCFQAAWFECVVGGVHHPQHTQISSNSSMIATDNNTV